MDSFVQALADTSYKWSDKIGLSTCLMILEWKSECQLLSSNDLACVSSLNLTLDVHQCQVALCVREKQGEQHEEQDERMKKKKKK